MGCGAATAAPDKARFGTGSGPTWMDDVECREGDERLQDCQFPGWGNHDCYLHYEDASVICQPGMQMWQLEVNIIYITHYALFYVFPWTLTCMSYKYISWLAPTHLIL